jgi:putative toxin-antitoxin system antitoxin component (TIGR02293 family)
LDAKVVPAGHGANDLDLAKAVEAGLPVGLLRRMLTQRYIELVDVALIMPMRTFHHRKAARARLTTDESDRVMRIAQLTAAASDALGDLERGKLWLRTPNPALRGERPLDWVRTTDGTRVVQQILGRIAHGIGF